MQAEIRILKAIAFSHPNVLEPERNTASRVGFSWNAAREILGCTPGDEQKPLDDLVTGGFLDHEFREKILLCPFSREVHVAFREICPSCHSADIDRQSMIHHFRCGHVGPEQKFFRNARMVCPKCEVVLQHIGVDYERPSQVFVCEKCRWAGSLPRTEGLCLGCGRLFEPEQALETRIQAYRLTVHGALAAQEGTMAKESNSSMLVDQAFHTLSIQAMSLIYQTLHQQALRYKRPLSVICAQLDRYPALVEKHGLVMVGQVVKEATEVLHNNLRTCDLLCNLEPHLLLAVLPETPLLGAQIAGGRLLETFRKRKVLPGDDRCTITVAIASLEQEGHQPDAGSQFDIARALVLKASEAGGDRMVGAGTQTQTGGS